MKRDPIAMKKIKYVDLLCHALNHRWIPYGGEVGVIAGAKVILWELRCNTGCGSSATEWRDMNSLRIPGTRRQYNHHPDYKAGNGYKKDEYWQELLARGFDENLDRRDVRIRRRRVS